MTNIDRSHTAIETIAGPGALTMKQLDVVSGGYGDVKDTVAIMLLDVAIAVLNVVQTVKKMI